jgi:hypothetical protein
MGHHGGDAVDGSNLAGKRAIHLGALFQLTDKLYRARGLPDIFAASLDAITTTCVVREPLSCSSMSTAS